MIYFTSIIEYNHTLQDRPGKCCCKFMFQFPNMSNEEPMDDIFPNEHVFMFQWKPFGLNTWKITLRQRGFHDIFPMKSVVESLIMESDTRESKGIYSKLDLILCCDVA